MKPNPIAPAFLALAVEAWLAAGCGRSGTWQDDPANWRRAFGSTRPADVVVTHSSYWRSPHWTFEYEYFFHIRANERFRTQLFAANDLERVAGPGGEPSARTFFRDKPAWFLPKPRDAYDVWRHRAEPKGNFRVFIDRETGDLFLTDYQV